MESLKFYILFFLFMCVILITRYFLASGVFYYISHRQRKIAKQSKIQKDIWYSVQSCFVFALVSVLFIWMIRNDYSKLYYEINLYPIWYGPLSLFIFLILQDTYFYWTHRLMHLVSFKKYHFAHHESRYPTAWTSFAFHPVEALIQAIFIPLFILFIPMHLYYFFFALLVMSVFGITNHLGYEIYPRFLEKKLFLITATHHGIHHRFVNKNFGLFFTFWDLVMKTEHTADYQSLMSPDFRIKQHKCN